MQGTVVAHVFEVTTRLPGGGAKVDVVRLVAVERAQFATGTRVRRRHGRWAAMTVLASGTIDADRHMHVWYVLGDRHGRPLGMLREDEVTGS